MTLNINEIFLNLKFKGKGDLKISFHDGRHKGPYYVRILWERWVWDFLTRRSKNFFHLKFAMKGGGR